MLKLTSGSLGTSRSPEYLRPRGAFASMQLPTTYGIRLVSRRTDDRNIHMRLHLPEPRAVALSRWPKSTFSLALFHP